MMLIKQPQALVLAKKSLGGPWLQIIITKVDTMSILISLRFSL